ncbi:hypothetical protein DFH09DRAFT_1101778 [Mycena vulgaris]|nr:hypothetical protein DFH09DRAFT_1101778 [Mycena vulgaris]
MVTKAGCKRTIELDRRSPQPLPSVGSHRSPAEPVIVPVRLSGLSGSLTRRVKSYLWLEYSLRKTLSTGAQMVAASDSEVPSLKSTSSSRWTEVGGRAGATPGLSSVCTDFHGHTHGGGLDAGVPQGIPQPLGSTKDSRRKDEGGQGITEVCRDASRGLGTGRKSPSRRRRRGVSQGRHSCADVMATGSVSAPRHTSILTYSKRRAVQGEAFKLRRRIAPPGAAQSWWRKVRKGYECVRARSTVRIAPVAYGVLPPLVRGFFTTFQTLRELPVRLGPDWIELNWMRDQPAKLYLPTIARSETRSYRINETIVQELNRKRAPPPEHTEFCAKVYTKAIPESGLGSWMDEPEIRRAPHLLHAGPDYDELNRGFEYNIAKPNSLERREELRRRKDHSGQGTTRDPSSARKNYSLRGNGRSEKDLESAWDLERNFGVIVRRSRQKLHCMQSSGTSAFRTNFELKNRSVRGIGKCDARG